MDNVPFFLTQPLHQTEPFLVIERQPKKRGYRFRYSSEGQTHGGIPGEPDKSNDNRKVYPSLRLHGHNGQAKVVVTLVTAEDNQPHLHAHSLIVNKVMTKGFHVYEMNGESSLELKSIAIQHVVKENLLSTLMDRILQTRFVETFGWNSGLNVNGTREEMFDVSHYVQSLMDRHDDTVFYDRATAQAIAGVELENLRKKANDLAKKMQMNQCRLCFQAFLPDSHGKFTRILNPVYSDIIYDGKTKQGAMLKIIRLSKVSCSVKGDEEVWLLADKLNPDDIEVRFFEKETKLSTSMVPWEDTGKFNKTDIYKQVCLIFKTPMYHDQNIRQPANVFIQLRRKTDTSCCSEPMEFKYTPIQYDRYGIGEKRKKEIPMHEFSSLSLPKKRFSEMSTPPISELPQDELLANAENYNAPFMMSNDPYSTLNLGAFVKQEESTESMNTESELQQQQLLSVLLSAQQLPHNDLQHLLNSEINIPISSQAAGTSAVASTMELPSLTSFSNATLPQFTNSDLNKYFSIPDDMGGKS
ncbi:nuclear factor NF-kappa-B p105 subunit-like [Hydractinia symbiolongicarpus]|uniref:nuclear factor NF-kappa-B p105 subunit-like n=1 Tax=Hydractinia symbiolongicarpus TaxID=13093 RepID=UPI00254E1BCA|nr:nuclear factor NF-kappa-B p105 subunit-like [Hydractinia symbiolongicarpus]